METKRERKAESHKARRVLRRSAVSRAGGRRVPEAQPQDLLQYEPNDLRDRVFQALSSVAPEVRAGVCRRLVEALEGAGVDLSTSLLLLGILAREPEHLTPLDAAKLIRYVRINSPYALRSVDAQIVGLVQRPDGAVPPARPLHKAA